MNSLSVSGFVATDPQLRTTQGGKRVTNLHLRVDVGASRAEPFYIGVVAWEELAVECARFAKGEALAVEGRLQVREWEDQKNGQRRTSVEVVVRTVHQESRGPTPKRPAKPERHDEEEEVPF